MVKLTFFRGGLKRVGYIAVIAIILSVFASCDDNFDDITKYEKFYQDPVIVSGSPEPGNSGIITVLDKGDTTVKILWVKGTDESTLQANLFYKVVYSLDNNISTADDAENNGLTALDWTQNIADASVTALAELSTYYFNVLIRDGDGHVNAYKTASAATTGSVIYMFSGGVRQGDMTTMWTASARNDIDNYCVNAKYSQHPTLPCTNIRTFISISSTDCIANMPSNFGVPQFSSIRGTGGVEIAGDWADLLDGSISTTLFSAGIVFDQWWSGSQYDGTFDASSNCSGWTSTSVKGRAGKFNKTDSQWIIGLEPNCSASADIICVCW